MGRRMNATRKFDWAVHLFVFTVVYIKYVNLMKLIIKIRGTPKELW